jgi:hypothetical protein
MMNLPFLAGAIGVTASCVLILFSFLLPRWFVSTAVHQIDAFRFGDRIFSKKESQTLGVFIHLIFSMFFGALFGVGMNMGIFDVGLLSMTIYLVIISLILGGIVLPVEGHGLFGWREDHWIPVDLIAMNTVWIFIFWGLLVALI